MPKKITIELTDEEHKRFVNAKMDRGLRSLQALMIGATERDIAKRPQRRLEAGSEYDTTERLASRVADLVVARLSK